MIEFLSNAAYSAILRGRFREAQVSAIRSGSKLSINKMSIATGIVYSHLHNWLNSKARMSDEKIQKVADFLDTLGGE